MTEPTYDPGWKPPREPDGPQTRVLLLTIAFIFFVLFLVSLVWLATGMAK